jgi:hypothetical protein
MSHDCRVTGILFTRDGIGRAEIEEARARRIAMRPADFDKAVGETILGLGGRLDGDRWVIDTIAGPLRVRSLGRWIACRFDDARAACAAIHYGQPNPRSGKWNFHFASPTRDDLAFFDEQLRLLVPAAPPAPKQMNLFG